MPDRARSGDLLGDRALAGIAWRPGPGSGLPLRGAVLGPGAPRRRDSRSSRVCRTVETRIRRQLRACRTAETRIGQHLRRFRAPTRERHTPGGPSLLLAGPSPAGRTWRDLAPGARACLPSLLRAWLTSRIR